MDVSKAADGTFERGDDGRFAGDVWLRSTVSAPDGTNIGIVHFSAGARTHWHQHPGGQFLYGVSGRGRVRTRGAVGTELMPGDVVYVEPGAWHFHGGAPYAPMAHVAINGGGGPEWGDPVTDDEYDEGF